jgi:phospholipid/cholesterol/gamma-HCH transport system permease protein
MLEVYDAKGKRDSSAACRCLGQNGSKAVNGEAMLTSKRSGEHLVLTAAGAWTAVHANDLEPLVEAQARSSQPVRSVEIDVAGIQNLDTFGAWLVERLARAWSARGIEARIVGLSENYRGLVQEVHTVNLKPVPPPVRENRIFEGLATIGRTLASMGRVGLSILQMLGAVTVAAGRAVAHPRRFRLTSLVAQIDRVGWHGVPIILLITFLIGAILAQQGIFHFRKFGADIFVVDMIGILVLREVGVLIVCVMVAGRSGSSYTAELGSMKMREEIDALRTMGFDPVQVLILPRVLALVISVPILTFLGSMAALYGGGLVCWLYGGINPDVFLSRLREAISLQTFEVGMIKAPIMALVIGIIAAVEGMDVKGSAESLGAHTTSSVVISIFLVIVLDGLFAVFFASIGM